ncbi:hypothetical protein T4A_2466 [Trichinella pseudospiralis]|uniref:Uncharacterized protein n=1 Tax=Trichinella pseudospiralis TaxID=6337 RepID=A0A0V1EK84_TRIPS|nr:hypothetical protein T4A_2466 [Trichinella pseudospiralis]
MPMSQWKPRLQNQTLATTRDYSEINDATGKHCNLFMDHDHTSRFSVDFSINFIAKLVLVGCLAAMDYKFDSQSTTQSTSDGISKLESLCLQTCFYGRAHDM